MTRILVIDDEEDMLVMIKNILKKRKYYSRYLQKPLTN